MKIAISGATGLIGSALADHLRARGDTVARLVRHESDLQPGDVLWSVDDQRLDPDDLVGTDAVVHLAGAPIGQRTHHRGSQVEAAIEVWEEHEVVLGAMTLGERPAPFAVHEPHSSH